MKTHYTYLVRLLPLVITIFLFSCAKDEGPFVVKDAMGPLDPIPSNGIPDPTVFSYPISFASDIKPIFQASCLQGCHNPNHPTLDLRPSVAYNQLTSLGVNAPYVNATNPESSSLYLHLVGVYTPMPKNNAQLSQGLIDTVYTWIYQGTLNN